MEPKRIVILGSTGSIGENALRVVSSLPGRFEVAGIAAGRNARRAAEQAAAHGCRRVALADEKAAAEAASLLAGTGIRVEGGAGAVRDLAGETEADLVLCAMVGMAALPPVLAAVDSGKDVALATKEVLVAAGSFVTARARAKGANLLPVDSEHSAIFQALADVGRVPACARNRALPGVPREPSEPVVEKLWLTASGGPFFFRDDLDPEKIRPEDALAHPRWKMGPKVTVDSSTMMNKGLEILEARWLFDIPSRRIGVLVHPESVVHSLVEMRDGAQMAQLGVPDMRLPIQYAMTWPERVPNAALPRLDLAKTAALHFTEPDENRFPCLALAREADRRGGVAACAMNAANEVAVAEFLAGRIRWTDIARIVAAAVEDAPDVPSPGLGDVFAADARARAFAAEKCAARA